MRLLYELLHQLIYVMGLVLRCLPICEIFRYEKSSIVLSIISKQNKISIL